MANPSIVPIPQSPEPLELELLVRARELLEHALHHASSPAAVDRMIAIHDLDGSVEFVIKTTATHLDYDSVSGSTFPSADLGQMAADLNKFLKDNYSKRLPYLQDIKALRQLRNLVQHGALDPASELKRFCTVAQGFFSKVVETVFGLPADELRVSSIVLDPDVRASLRQAEEAVDSGRYLESVVASRNAFENALLGKRGNSELLFRAIPVLAERESLSWPMREFLRALVDDVTLAHFGVPGTKLDRFRDLMHRIPPEHAPEKSGFSPLGRPWSLGDARFCYALVTQLALAWQAETSESDSLPVVDDHRLEETLADIDLSAFKHAFAHFDEERELYLAYITAGEKGTLEHLVPAQPYGRTVRVYNQGHLERETTTQVILDVCDMMLATHDPERWELLLGMHDRPFTWHQKRYEGGRLVFESPALNSCSPEELSSAGGLPLEAAERVVGYRVAHGPIRSEDDLRQVDQITEEQIRQMMKFTRL